MKLQFLSGRYAVSRLLPDQTIPDWAANNFFALTRTPNELSIVAPEGCTPNDIKSQRNFACFRVIGDLEFDVVGVIAAISSVLADAKIPILSISTYDTDYFLVSSANMEPARLALVNAGYEFEL